MNKLTDKQFKEQLSSMTIVMPKSRSKLKSLKKFNNMIEKIKTINFVEGGTKPPKDDSLSQ